MSFAEEEMYDMYDPYYEYEYEEERLGEELEGYWKKGKHLDQNGKVWKIKEMTTFHLQNTIELFGKRFNVENLIKELNKRTYGQN